MIISYMRPHPLNAQCTMYVCMYVQCTMYNVRTMYVCTMYVPPEDIPLQSYFHLGGSCRDLMTYQVMS